MASSLPPFDFSGGSSGPTASGGSSLPRFDFSGASYAGSSEPQDRSFLGFGKHFVQGAIQTAFSLPAVAIDALTNPIHFTKETASSVAHLAAAQAPLVRAGANLVSGDIPDAKKFYEQYRQWFYEPENVFPATLFILGGGKGIGGRIGALREVGLGAEPLQVARAAAFGWDAPAATRFVSAQLGKDIPGVGQIGEPIVTKSIGRGHYAANRAYAADAIMKMLPPQTPLFGEAKRVARATSKEGRVNYLRYLSAPEYIARQKAYAAMTKSERSAAELMNKIPHGEDVATWIENLRMEGSPEAEATIRQLNDPKIRKLFNDPNPRMLAYHAAGQALAPIRTQIMIDTGALTLEEAKAAPWRLTRILRGAKLATPNWLYKNRRKFDAEISALMREKGRLVPAVAGFARGDTREAMRVARENSNAAIAESDLRGGLIKDLQRTPRLTDLQDLRAEESQILARLEEHKVSSLGVDVELQLKHQLTDVRRRISELENVPKLEGVIPETRPDVTSISQETDNAFNAKQDLNETLDMLNKGEMDTNLFLRTGVDLPQGVGLGRMEEAMVEAVHGKLLGEHTAELNADLALLKLARERRLSTRQLDAEGEKIPSDLRKATEEELRQATEKRVYRDTLAANLKRKQARGYKGRKLTQAEIDRVTNQIEELNKEIRDLENPRPIHRAPSETKRRFESRYSRVEKKLMKRIAAKRKEIADIGQKVGYAGTDPWQQLRIGLTALIDKRYRVAALRYERAVAAEITHGESVKRHLEILERQAKDKQELDRIRELRINFIQGQRLRLHDLNETIAEKVALRHSLEAKRGQLVGGGTPEELTAEAIAKGRPIPYYSPDEMLKEEGRGYRGAAEGSILAQRLRGDIYDSRSILLRTGMLALYPDTLSPAYFRAAKHDLNTTMHQIAMRSATKISKNAAVPAGYEYLRRTSGETISETAKYRGEHLRALEEEYGREKDISTKDSAAPDIDFSDADGSTYRLIIPKAYADEFRAEALRSNTAIGRIFKNGTDVWRSLVLHLRLPWLVNNIVGNTFLFAMRFAGVRGLANFARMIASNPATRKFIPQMERIALPHLTDEQMRVIFPEQVRGTHFETQTPELSTVFPNALRQRTAESRAGTVGVNTLSGIPRLLPRADKATERRLRRAATNEILRSSPEVKAIYKTMKKQGSGTFHDAVTKAIADDPHFRDYVVREVNDALGNFLSLTRSERNALRKTVPFYAWLREISRITAHTLADRPGRVALLSQMAQVASEIQPQDVPRYMAGSVLGSKLGWLSRITGGDEGGLSTVLQLHGASPYGTVADLGYSLAALAPGSNKYNVRDFAGQFHPAIQAGYNVAAFGGEGNLLGRYAEELAGSVPQYNLIQPRSSAITPTRDRLDILTKLLLANPKVLVDPYEASYQRSQGR